MLCLFLFVAGAAAQTVQLEDYLLAAQANSPLLRDYRNTVLRNQLDSQLIRASYGPQLALTSINGYSPVFGNVGFDLNATNGGQYSTLLSLSKSFTGKENLERQFRAVQLSSDSVGALSAIAMQDLQRSVSAQYLTTYGDQQLLRANEEINTLLRNEGTILKNLTQQNIYRQTDYLTFLVTQKQQEIQLQQLRIQYQTDFSNLNFLCGVLDTAVLQRRLALPQLLVTTFANTFASAFFRRYRIDSLRLANEARLLNLSYRPKVGVFADAGYNAVMLQGIGRTFGFGGGISISMPIYNGGRRKMQLAQIALQESSRQGYESFFALQYNQQIAGLLQQLQNTESLRSSIEEQITYTQGLIEVNGKLLQTGDARIPDFVIAINNYLTAKNLLTQNQIGRLQIINQLNYWNR